MTAALRARPAAQEVPPRGAAGASSRPRRTLLPQLLPVPDSEPPLRRLPADDEAPLLPDAPTAGRHRVPPARPIAGTDAGLTSAANPTERWRRTVPSPPPMVHRRWRAAPGAVPTPQGIRALPHQVHSAVGIVTASDDTAWPIVTAPVEPAPRPRRRPASDVAVVLARATIEALSGRRPIAQLRPHYAEGVFEGLQEFPMLGHRRDTQLVSLWVCEPTDSSAEISAAFRCGTRTRAMAMQLRARGSHWFVTSLQLA